MSLDRTYVRSSSSREDTQTDSDESAIRYMLQGTTIRDKLPLERYDPSLPLKEKGCEVILSEDIDVVKKQCCICKREDHHYNYQCPDLHTVCDVDRLPCILCKKNDHNYFSCPAKDDPPLGPLQPFVHPVCYVCGVEGEHGSRFCPENKPFLIPAHMDCKVCDPDSYDGEHCTEDCVNLNRRKYCIFCDVFDDHYIEDCSEAKKESLRKFCDWCGSALHSKEDCPDVEELEYCSFCNDMGDHTYATCHMRLHDMGERIYASC